VPAAECVCHSAGDTESVSGGSLWMGEEERLLAAAKCGDRAAFGELFERCAGKLLHTTLRITGNREDAEDAVQEAYLSAMLHLQSFDERSTFSTWLTRIAINAALMKLRRNRRLREVPMEMKANSGDEPEEQEFAGEEPNPEQWYVEHESQRIVREAVFHLRPTLRKAVEFYHLKEQSIQETAEMLDISMEAVKGRLYQARAALRRAPRIRKMIGSPLESTVQ
jgi:RNA polymerase sigma factor (sigma-70 family)